VDIAALSIRTLAAPLSRRTPPQLRIPPHSLHHLSHKRFYSPRIARPLLSAAYYASICLRRYYASLAPRITRALLSAHSSCATFLAIRRFSAITATSSRAVCRAFFSAAVDALLWHPLVSAMPPFAHSLAWAIVAALLPVARFGDWRCSHRAFARFGHYRHSSRAFYWRALFIGDRCCTLCGHCHICGRTPPHPSRTLAALFVGEHRRVLSVQLSQRTLFAASIAIFILVTNANSFRVALHAHFFSVTTHRSRRLRSAALSFRSRQTALSLFGHDKPLSLRSRHTALVGYDLPLSLFGHDKPLSLFGHDKPLSLFSVTTNRSLSGHDTPLSSVTICRSLFPVTTNRSLPLFPLTINHRTRRLRSATLLGDYRLFFTRLLLCVLLGALTRSSLRLLSPLPRLLRASSLRL
jgi:hypothetical protein